MQNITRNSRSDKQSMVRSFHFTFLSQIGAPVHIQIKFIHKTANNAHSFTYLKFILLEKIRKLNMKTTKGNITDCKNFVLCI